MKQLLRLSPFLRAYWWQILLSLIFLLCLTGLSLVIPGIIRQVIDVGLSQGEVTLLIQSATIILVTGITRAIIIYFQHYLNEWVAGDCHVRLRTSQSQPTSMTKSTATTWIPTWTRLPFDRLRAHQPSLLRQAQQ